MALTQPAQVAGSLVKWLEENPYDGRTRNVRHALNRLKAGGVEPMPASNGLDPQEAASRLLDMWRVLADMGDREGAWLLNLTVADLTEVEW
ncbi:hypothetical protein [Bifidobacterium felsineum]|uniref:hypothetical protein n=1 Tax=Bifidobacterium felsineum TaxID=2045440 RepID=UPI001BDC0546|nr:hypothetical protein [Bifidobacterium felsineum]MBT1164553.1 hypothetical protein [Bifidobacterium felsineum]